MEINVLTGETQILAADLAFDCGKSLNPAVDMGQVSTIVIQQGQIVLKRLSASNLSFTCIDQCFKWPSEATVSQGENMNSESGNGYPD